MIAEDSEFKIYSHSAGCMTGHFRDGRLTLESEVYGDEDSELICRFSETDTGKILEKMTLDELIAYLQETHTRGLEKLMDELEIDWEETVE